MPAHPQNSLSPFVLLLQPGGTSVCLFGTSNSPAWVLSLWCWHRSWHRSCHWRLALSSQFKRNKDRVQWGTTRMTEELGCLLHNKQLRGLLTWKKQGSASLYPCVQVSDGRSKETEADYRQWAQLKHRKFNLNITTTTKSLFVCLFLICIAS